MTKRLIWQEHRATTTAPDELSCVTLPNNNQRERQCRRLTGLPQLPGGAALSDRVGVSTRRLEPCVRKGNLLRTFPEHVGTNKSISLAEGQISSSCLSCRGRQIFLSFTSLSWHRTSLHMQEALLSPRALFALPDFQSSSKHNSLTTSKGGSHTTGKAKSEAI